MSIKKILVGTAAGALVLVVSVFPVFASSPFKSDLSNNNWRVFNINTTEPKLWDINKAPSLEDGGVGFTFNQLDTGWFSVYLKTNYGDLTGKTIEADTSWTASDKYISRSLTTSDAYFRLEFQSAQGNYDSNDYWWSTVSCNLNTDSECTLTASLMDRELWTNQSGKSATDTTEDWVQWQGDIVHMSPYDGFTYAMENVKEVGLSFGRAGSYASGVAIDGTVPASFQLNSFTVTQ